jgi:AbrB family looped-hinge helix DNA binding protein
MKSSNSMKHEQFILGIVTVNNKGQVVIPADARSTINLQAGDKLLVIVHPSHEGVVLIKPDGLELFANRMLTQISDARVSHINNNNK